MIFCVYIGSDQDCSALISTSVIQQDLYSLFSPFRLKMKEGRNSKERLKSNKDGEQGISIISYPCQFGIDPVLHTKL